MSSIPILENIKKYFRICPDYEGCFGYFSVDNCCYGCDDDTLELEGYEDTPFKVPGIEKWCYEWDEMAHAAKDKTPCLVNADEWIKRGRQLAQELRQILPDDIVLLFKHGDKDEYIDKITYFVLEPDYAGFPGRCNEYDIYIEDNTIEVGDFPPITLSGLGEWYDVFDKNIVFPGDPIDTSIDWEAWYRQGLWFAFNFRQILPASVSIWYRVPYELRGVLQHPDLLIGFDGKSTIANFLKSK